MCVCVSAPLCVLLWSDDTYPTLGTWGTYLCVSDQGRRVVCVLSRAVRKAGAHVATG